MTVAEALAERLRSASPIELPLDVVESCIDARNERSATAERQFGIAFRGSLADVPRGERDPGLNGVTGHIAESVVETMLVESGWTPLEHFVGPFSGGHGIDLAMLAPDFETTVAVEVKGTLATRRWPRLRPGDLPQLSPEWLAKPDNPGVQSLGLDPEGLAVLAVIVHFGRREWRAAASIDLVSAFEVASFEEFGETIGLGIS